MPFRQGQTEVPAKERDMRAVLRRVHDLLRRCPAGFLPIGGRNEMPLKGQPVKEMRSANLSGPLKGIRLYQASG